MKKKISSLFLVILFTLFGLQMQVKASEGQHVEGTHQVIEKEEKGFDAKEMIMEHISDSNEWHLWTTKSENGEEHHVSIPLPIIIKDKEGFHFFMSSAIAHGHEH